MKLLLLLGAAVCIVLFVAGVVSPAASRRLQGVMHRWTRRGEARGDASAGRAGDVTRDSLKKVRDAGDTSARAGREMHDKLTGSREETPRSG